MSEPMDIRYCAACAGVTLVKEAGLLDLSEKDFEFLIMPKPWVANERARARLVVESSVYGTLDYLGLPRFAVPAEFIAGAIAYYVHPVNAMYACAVFEGVEWSENVINGIERPVRAADIFAMVLRIKAGDEKHIENKFKDVKKKLKV